jgi:curved DNA-binding protein CbpA
MFIDRETQTDTDFYKVLNVDPDADAEVIRVAYRALARRDHPDVNADPGASSKMAELNAAFEVLGDARSRAVYDQSRKALVATSHKPAGRPVASPAEWSAAGQTGYRQPLGARGAAQSQSGTVLEFGRYAGRSLSDLARDDPDYLEWLARTMIGHAYQAEIEKLLALRRPRPLTVSTPARGRRGLFGRLLG